jgi:sec-independent protein translocase protein TatC
MAEDQTTTASSSSEPTAGPGEEMTFTGHLDELRQRLIRCIIASVIGFLGCYAFAERLFNLLMAPLIEVLPPKSTLIFTSLPEAFFTYLKVAFVAGLFAVSPYIFYQIWKFVAPGLYDSERRYFIPMAFFSAMFFVCGALFGYFVVFPFGFKFFMGFATDFIRPMPTIREYLGFSLKLLIAFGVIFELPLFIFFLARLGMVTAPGLRKKRKYAILCSFVVSAVLTPPDVVSQTLMAGPLVILYELGIWVAHFFGKKKKQPPTDETDNNDDAVVQK